MSETDADSRVLALALAASQTLDADEFLERVAAGLVDLLGRASVHAYLEIPGERELELRRSWSEKRRASRRPPARLDPESLPEPDAHSEALAFGSGQGSAVFLVVREREGEGFDAASLARARTLARVLGPTVGILRHVSELRETAVRDDIARCYNRRHFESFLGEEVARARRFRTRVSVVFLDMDDLKSINTAHGHALGSRSLQQVAERIVQGIRGIDKLFRFGGDEFCLVLPETDATGAREVAERTRRAIAGAPFLVEEVGGVPLSASLGVATFPDHASDADALIETADRAMQSVKQLGKNRVAVAPPAASPDRGAAPGPRAAGRTR